MDALTRLLGEERKSLGDGVWLHRAPASAYLRAYAAQKSAGDGTDGNVRFVAELLAGGLRDDDGKPFFVDGAAALEGLPIAFIIETSPLVTRMNGLDEDEGGLEGKSESAR